MRTTYIPAGNNDLQAFPFHRRPALCAFRIGSVRNYAAKYPKADDALRRGVIHGVYRIRHSSKLADVPAGSLRSHPDRCIETVRNLVTLRPVKVDRLRIRLGDSQR